MSSPSGVGRPSPALDLAAGVRGGSPSAADVVERHLSAIDTHGPPLENDV